jgi:rSAM/selenodomain-associated transferase 2
MKISVIIPVLHEQALINTAIGRLRSMEANTDLEIIVVDGSEEADTLAAVTDGGIIGIMSQRGRGRQMNKGAEAARGGVLLFLHGDTELPASAFQWISSALEEDRFVGGAFDLGIDHPGLIFRLIEKIASLRSRLTRIPYGDQAIFLVRDYFVEIGGYSEIPLMEDVDLMRRIRRLRGRICVLPQRVKTSGRRWIREGAVRCTLRNWAILVLFLLGVRPAKLAKWYSQ